MSIPKGRVPSRKEMMLSMDVDAIKDAIGKAYPSIDDMTRAVLSDKVDKLHKLAQSSAPDNKPVEGAPSALERKFFEKLVARATSPMEVALACANIASCRRTMDDKLNPHVKRVVEDIDKFAAMLPEQQQAPAPNKNSDYNTIARRFHEVYEQLAPLYEWETQVRSRVSWDALPETQKGLMLETVKIILDEFAPSAIGRSWTPSWDFVPADVIDRGLAALAVWSHIHNEASKKHARDLLFAFKDELLKLRENRPSAFLQADRAQRELAAYKKAWNDQLLHVTCAANGCQFTRSTELSPAPASEPTEEMLQAALDADTGTLDTPLRELYRLIYMAMAAKAPPTTLDKPRRET